jgi:ribosomal protein L32
MTCCSPSEHSRRDGWRDGSAPTTPLACCPMCDGPLPSPRARYCTDACKQRAFRLRHQRFTRVDADELRRNLQRQRTLVAHTLYECSTCGERRLGERRCVECGLFSHALGLAGICPSCDEPILLTEMLDLE